MPVQESNYVISSAPVAFTSLDDSSSKPEEGIGLCLSGGGYRAMLFHAGAIIRINEAGLLPKIDRISSVSGGSITAGLLGLRWNDLKFDDESEIASNLQELVIEPIQKFSKVTIDWKSISLGLLLRGNAADRVAKYYAKYLFGNATLQQLPDSPRFVINATNLQSGALWRFSKPYIRDWKVGEVKNPAILLAKAVAASSAFPPILSPMVMKLNPHDFTPGSGEELQKEPYTSKVFLSDGGVYDNLGLETVWKRYKTVLVSDAGAALQAEPKVPRMWATQSLRILWVIDNQVRALRKRQLIQSYVTHASNDRDIMGRKGCYLGIGSDIANYPCDSKLHAPFQLTKKLAAEPTRLKAVSTESQFQLLNWGYAVCDAALRGHYVKDLQPPGDFPYPGGVG